MPKKLQNFASSSSALSQSKQDIASNLSTPQHTATHTPLIKTGSDLSQVHGTHTSSWYAQADKMSPSGNYTYEDIQVSDLDSTVFDPYSLLTNLRYELDLAMAQSGLGLNLDTWESGHPQANETHAADMYNLSADISHSSTTPVTQAKNSHQTKADKLEAKTTSLGSTHHPHQVSTQATENLPPNISPHPSQTLDANHYMQELNKLAQCQNLNQLTPQEQSTLINEYYSNFLYALNSIVLNCNNRFVVEQGLEHIMLYAPHIFALEYRNFFNICLNAAPKALFWMLQYPFYTNFFLLKKQSLSSFISNSTPHTRALDKYIAQEDSSTVNEYLYLKQEFSNPAVAHVNLQDNILLSLYEEQILQKQMLSPAPKLTQRQKLRQQVQNKGKLVQDPAKQRLNQINQQIFALHNLKFRELRSLTHTLETLAHKPHRLAKIFGRDLKNFHMNKQSLLQKINSWTQIYPVEQPCLLVHLDPGFFVRSCQEPQILYSYKSLRQTPLVILAGLEVCYQPELSVDQSTHKDQAPHTKTSTTSSKRKQTKAKEEPETKGKEFDLAHLSQAFKQLGSNMRQAKDKLKAQLQEKTGQVYSDALLNQALLSDSFLDEGDVADLLKQSDVFLSSKLQASDFTQEMFTTSEQTSEFQDSEIFKLDAIEPVSLDKDQNNRQEDMQVMVQDKSPREATSSAHLQAQTTGATAYLSGVFFGNQDATNTAQLQHFRDRQVHVDDIQLGFMVVTL